MKLKHTVACLLAFALALSAVSCQKSMNDDDFDKVITESVSNFYLGASVSLLVKQALHIKWLS